MPGLGQSLKTTPLRQSLAKPLTGRVLGTRSDSSWRRPERFQKKAAAGGRFSQVAAAGGRFSQVAAAAWYASKAAGSQTLRARLRGWLAMTAAAFQMRRSRSGAAVQTRSRPPARPVEGWSRRVAVRSAAVLAGLSLFAGVAVAAGGSGAVAAGGSGVASWWPDLLQDLWSTIPKARDLSDTLLLLGATTFVIPVMKLLKTSPIIGFLLIGLILGPSGCNLITHVEMARHAAEFGIVFFLFETGLELSVKKVISMRSDVFGLGMAQFVVTGALIAGFASRIAPSLSAGALVVTGGALAMSSSAFALQLLRENGQLGTRYGQASLGVLLFQDLAVVPLLVLVPLLVGTPGGGSTLASALGKALLKAVLAMGLICGAGHFLLRPLLYFVKRSGSSEAFLSVTLGVVLLSAGLTQGLGLSDTLGAFVGGVLVAETDYKHQIEADIAPFRGMLLGLFFVTVGFSLDLRVLANTWLTVLPLLFGVLALKAAVVAGFGLSFKLSGSSSVQTASLIAPGGEFAFVVVGLAERLGLLSPATASLLVTTTVLSMGLTPLIAAAGEAWATKIRSRRGPSNVEGRDQFASADMDRVRKSKEGFVVIIGYSDMGRTICNMLDAEGKAKYIVFENDPANASKARSRGLPVFLADCTKREVMENFKIGEAKMVVVTTPRRDTNRAVKAIRQFHPKLPMVVRAEDADHQRFLETWNVKAVVPVLISVRFGGAVLRNLGYPEDEIQALLQEQLSIQAAEAFVAKEGTAWINSLGRQQHWDKALSALRGFASHGLQRNVFMYGAAVAACKRGQQWVPALSLLPEMRLHGIAPDLVTYGAAIAACATVPEKSEKQWQIGLSLLAAAVAEAALQPLAVPSAVKIYGIAIDACSKVSQWPWALDLILSGMPPRRVVADTICYNAALDGLSRGMQWHRTLLLLEQMGGEANPNSVSYSITLASCGFGPPASAGKVTMALIEEMQARHISPSASSFSAALVACERTGRWQLGLQLLREMKAVNLRLDAACVSTLLGAMAKAQSWDWALHIFRDSAHQGLHARATARAAAIAACEGGWRWELSLRLLREPGADVDVVAFNTAISACSRSSRWEQALRLWPELVERGLQPSMVTFGAAASAMGEGQDWRVSLQLLKQLHLGLS
ncbi:unnamed protein product, partial [Polarella glacialis]